MKATVKKFEQALNEVDLDYDRYVKTMVNDGMIPLSFKEWATIKTPHHHEWVE